jgi:hypothetical protein
MAGPVTLSLFSGLLLCGLLAACQLGYLIGRRGGARRREVDQALAADTSTWTGAVLGLLGLLVGFTFAMAVARFDHRKQQIVAEANAIGTAYLRTRVLDEPGGMELRAMLRRYLDARIAFFVAGMSAARVAAADRETAGYEQEIWNEVVEAARASPTSLPVSLLVQATNEMFDIADARRAALDDAVPPAVFVLLVLVATIAMGAICYGCGLARRRHWFGMWIMPLLISSVIALVYDIGRPRVGIVRLSEASMLRLRDGL